MSLIVHMCLIHPRPQGAEHSQTNIVEAGLEVLLFDNALPVSRWVGSLWAGSHSSGPAGLDSWTGVGFPGQHEDINSTRQAPESAPPAG